MLEGDLYYFMILCCVGRLKLHFVHPVILGEQDHFFLISLAQLELILRCICLLKLRGLGLLGFTHSTNPTSPLCHQIVWATVAYELVHAFSKFLSMLHITRPVLTEHSRRRCFFISPSPQISVNVFCVISLATAPCVVCHLLFYSV